MVNERADRSPGGGASGDSEARGEVWLNVAAGVSVLSWAVLGLRHTWMESGEIGAVRLCGSAIHALVGVLFLMRRSIRIDGTYRQLAMALPAFILGGLAFRWAPASVDWRISAVVLFVVGSVFTVVSLLTLGRSFAVLPALRQVVARGPYRWVRHPAYAGETLLVLAMVLASLELRSCLVLAAFLPAIVLRIRAEEQVMASSGEYGAYREKVRWRLLPGVW